MAVSVTNIDAEANTSGATLALNVPVGGVPAGALIIVCVCDRSSSATPGSVMDSAGNTYTAAMSKNLNGSAAQGIGTIFYAFNVAALILTNTITYTKVTSGARAAMSGFYATGTTGNPLDPTASAAVGGNNSSPIANSLVPTFANDLFVAMIAQRGSSGTFTQDSTHGAWATPPIEASSGTATTDARVNGGVLVVSDQLVHTYAPSYSVSSVWADIIVAFRVAGPFAATGNADGISSVAGVGASLAAGTGNADGIASVAGASSFLQAQTGGHFLPPTRKELEAAAAKARAAEKRREEGWKESADDLERIAQDLRGTKPLDAGPQIQAVIEEADEEDDEALEYLLLYG